MKELVKEAFSANEKYVSMLVIIAVIFTAIDIILAFMRGDIPDNMYFVTVWLYGFVAVESGIGTYGDVQTTLNGLRGKESK